MAYQKQIYIPAYPGIPPEGKVTGLFWITIDYTWYFWHLNMHIILGWNFWEVDKYPAVINMQSLSHKGLLLLCNNTFSL